MISAIDQDLEWMRIQVAERLGWRQIEYSNDGYLVGYAAGRKLYSVVPSYVRDIKAAWTLVDYLLLHGLRTKLDCDFSGNARCFCAELEYQGKVVSSVHQLTAPLAICQAFLEIPAERLASSSSFIHHEKARGALQ